MTNAQYDILAMGRSSIDVYSNDVGSPFVEIKSFAAYVGGDFVLNFLEQEGVETAFIARKPGRRISAVVLGIEPPSGRMPLERRWCWTSTSGRTSGRDRH